MGGINCCVFGGTLASEVEGREYQQGKVLSNFDLACDDIWKDADGHRNKVTEWVHCVCYGNEAKITLKYFRVGEYYLVEGKMRTDYWMADPVTGKAVTVGGVKKHRTRIVVHRIHMMTLPPRGTKPPPRPTDEPTENS